MHPKPVEADPAQPPLGRRRVKERREAKDLGGLAGEKLRLDDPDAGIDERRDMARIARTHDYSTSVPATSDDETELLAVKSAISGRSAEY